MEDGAGHCEMSSVFYSISRKRMKHPINCERGVVAHRSEFPSCRGLLGSVDAREKKTSRREWNPPFLPGGRHSFNPEKGGHEIQRKLRYCVQPRQGGGRSNAQALDNDRGVMPAGNYLNRTGRRVGWARGGGGGRCATPQKAILLNLNQLRRRNG